MDRNINQRLKSLRTDSGKSCKRLADALYTSESSVRRIERGDVDPHLSTIIRYTEIFNVPIEYIVDGVAKSDSQLFDEINNPSPEMKRYVIENLKLLKDLQLHFFI